MSSKIITSALLASVIAVSATANAQVNETSTPVMTVKPKAGASFVVGARRAVSYFTAADTTCKLVLTLADAPSFGEVPTITTTRFEAAIPAGKAAQYQGPDGAALEFACHSDAQSMTIKPLSQMVSGVVR